MSAKRQPRKAETYRAARRNNARKQKLIWRTLPRVLRNGGHFVEVNP